MGGISDGAVRSKNACQETHTSTQEMSITITVIIAITFVNSLGIGRCSSILKNVILKHFVASDV